MRVAGIGFRRGARLQSLQAVLDLAEATAGPVDALATLPEKADVPELAELAKVRNLPILPVPVRGVQTVTQSPRIFAMHGTGSVAEAAALVAAGRGARLILVRLSAPDGMATAAIAESPGDRT